MQVTFLAALWGWLARFLPAILSLIGGIWTANELQEIQKLKDELTKPVRDARDWFDGTVDQLVPKGTPGASPDTDSDPVTFNEVAKDAVNNPASLAWIAVGLLVLPLVIRQVRGLGYDIADATKGVYEEGKTQISGAREQVRHGVRHVQTGVQHARNAHEYVRSAPTRRGK